MLQAPARPTREERLAVSRVTMATLITRLVAEGSAVAKYVITDQTTFLNAFTPFQGKPLREVDRDLIAAAHRYLRIQTAGRTTTVARATRMVRAIQRVCPV